MALFRVSRGGAMAGLGRSTMPKCAIVLAAGLGTRMRPYNGAIPKPLVAVGGKPLIDYALDRLAEAGVERAVVNVHHLADALERHLGSRKEPQIVISDERGTLLGTGGGIAKALPQLADAPFFLVNSDTLWLDGGKPNFARLADAFDAGEMDALLLLAPTAGSIGYEGTRRLTPCCPTAACGAAPSARWCRSSMPVRRSCRRCCSITPHPARFRSRCCSTAPASGAGCSACRLEGVWMHVGTPEAVTAAEAVLATAL